VEETSGKTKINSWNEWDSLKHVIVGVPDYSCVQAAEPAVDMAKLNQLFASEGRDAFWARYPEAKKNLDEQGWTQYPDEVIAIAENEMNFLVKTLEDHGVRVDRPTPIDFSQKTQTPDWVQDSMVGIMPPRDFLLPIGNEIIEATMSQRSRWFEFICYRDLLEQYFREDPNFLWSAAPKPRLSDDSYVHDFWDEWVNTFTKEGEAAVVEKFTKNRAWRNTEKEPLWDAADLMRFGKDVFVQLSVMTNDAGFDWLKRHLEPKGFRVHPMLFGSYLPWHIDTTFFAARPGLLFQNAHYPPLDTRFHELLRLNDWEIVDLVEPTVIETHPLSSSSIYLAYNVFSIDPNTIIVEAGETALHEQLDKYGITPVPVPFGNVAPFGGALHCATCDITREGDMEDYFPKQIEGY